VVAQYGLGTAERLNDDRIDFGPHLLHIVPLTLQLLKHDLDTPLMTHVQLLLVRIEDEIGVVLIDRVIGEVHAHVFKVAEVGGDVFLSGKSNKSIIKYKDPHRITSCQ